MTGKSGEPASGAGMYRAVGVALAVASILAFSVRPVMIKIAYSYVTDPVTLLALRMLFSMPFLLAAAWWLTRGTRAYMTGRDMIAVFLLGCLGYYLASFLDFLGLQYVTAGVGRLILFVYPTIVVLLSALFLKKPPTRRDLVALAITYAGVALVVSRFADGENANFILGALLVFGSAIAYAVYLVIGSHVVHRVGSMRFAAYATSVAGMLAILQFFALRPMTALDLPWQVYGLAILIAVVSTVIPIFMTAEALKRIGANDVAMIGALGPVSAIFLGYIGLDETLTLMQMAGAALVLAGVLLVTLKPSA
ncbi:MAG TPA: DMT family transporter [Dongiaceae bacterium]|jgi:drug/metabolite transporter (DMT)-like permease